MTVAQDMTWRVVKITDSGRRVLVRRKPGDRIVSDQRFLVYQLDDERVIDPETGEDLGYFEIVKGYGRVDQIQEKFFSLKSDNRAPDKRVIRKSSVFVNPWNDVEETIIPGSILPFDDPQPGDLVRPV